MPAGLVPQMLEKTAEGIAGAEAWREIFKHQA
jgi:hypothetical protein